MMRTSASQFEVMIDFMERNGDLNKPSDGPSGRLRAVDKWQELANALNLDTTGTSKPVEKWKKVWSDLKNNTKRKASKIHRAAGGTGGGPVSKLILTDQEQRVLSIIGPQAATGLVSVQEVGPPEPPVASNLGLLPVAVSPTPMEQVVQVESIIEEWNKPGEGGQSVSTFHTDMVDNSAISPTTHHAISPQRHTAPRRAISGRRRLLRSPAPAPPHSRRVPRRHFNATEQFLNSDEHWRNLATQFVTEHVRLRERELQQREVELQQQSQWQTLFAKLINLGEIIANKINSK
ncbi:unnamed protein product, partial [Brenthis ino]